MVFNFSNVFPNVILNKIDYKDVNIPEHWGLSQRHNSDVKKIISEQFSDFENFMIILI